MPVRTTNAALQRKLDELAAFAKAGDKQAFVEAFVPLDCSADDTNNYLSVLTEDDAEWAALAAELQAIAAGAATATLMVVEPSKAWSFCRSVKSRSLCSGSRRAVLAVERELQKRA